MTAVDKTTASDAEFRARIAPFEAADEPVEVVVEKVAQALWEEDGGDVRWVALAPDSHMRSRYRRLAAAAIAAMPTRRAEEALRRVEELATEWENFGTRYTLTAGLASEELLRALDTQ